MGRTVMGFNRWAAFIIGFALALRIALIVLGWPHLNADEGTMGLMALHIAYRGEWPIFFYGQSYMGSLEAYLAAPFFWMVGPSSVTLRLGLVLLFALFLGTMYLLVGQLYGKATALFSIALLSLGSEQMLFRQLQAIGGYMESLFFGALLLLIGSWLALNAGAEDRMRDRGEGQPSQWHHTRKRVPGTRRGQPCQWVPGLRPTHGTDRGQPSQWVPGLRPTHGRDCPYGRPTHGRAAPTKDLEGERGERWAVPIVEAFRPFSVVGAVSLPERRRAKALGYGSAHSVSRDPVPDGGKDGPKQNGVTRFSLSYGAGRVAAFGAWGLVAGVALWSDLLIVPFVVASGLMLAVFCRREIRLPIALCLVLGLLVGCSPVIAYTVSAGKDPAGIFLSTYRSAGHGEVAQGVAGTVLVGLPVMTGANVLCPVSPQSAWPVGANATRSLIACTAVHGAWGLGLVVLWLFAVGQAIRRVRRREDRREAIRVAGRLAVLGSAGLTVGLFMFSPAAADDPWFSARYLTCAWIALPALAAPLLERQWGGLPGPWWRWKWTALALPFAVLLLGTAETFADVPPVQSLNAWQGAFVSDLLQMHARAIYTDYWTCDRVAFQSLERVRCAVLGGRLQQGENRYPAYLAVVRRQPDPVYAFPLGSPQDRALEGSPHPPLRSPGRRPSLSRAPSPAREPLVRSPGRRPSLSRAPSPAREPHPHQGEKGALQGTTPLSQGGRGAGGEGTPSASRGDLGYRRWTENSYAFYQAIGSVAQMAG